MKDKNEDLNNYTLEKLIKRGKQLREEAKKYTEEQMYADIKKYELDKDFGIYIISEGESPAAEDSGYIIKNNDGTFNVVITGERAIPTSKLKVGTINEAMSLLVSKLKYKKSEEEYFRSKSMRR